MSATPPLLQKLVYSNNSFQAPELGLICDLWDLKDSGIKVAGIKSPAEHLTVRTSFINVYIYIYLYIMYTT